MKNKPVLASLLILLAVTSYLYASHNMSMWRSANTASNDASMALGAFVEASQWLSENLREGEIALVPFLGVFSVLNPELGDKLMDYESIWSSAGVTIFERGDLKSLERLRRYFIDFLQNNWEIKYVVRDWVEPYVTFLFGAMVSDELMFLLSEIKILPFTLSTGWSSKITIYEIVRYTSLFSVGLSYPPKGYSTSPPNARIQYSWSGATIEKVGPGVGLYLPLESGINASRKNFLTVQIRLDVEDLELAIVFYFDRNRDGVFSDYVTDYAKTATFNQNEMGWVRGQWYTIYQTIPQGEDPIVQIGIIVTGSKSGVVTVSNLVVYMQITPEDVLFETSSWLSENLKEDEIALVPQPALFSYNNPALRLKLTDYGRLWAYQNVTLQANLTEVLKVRKYFIDYLEGNMAPKYIIRDWVNPYAERLFEAMVSDELMFLLQEVKEMFFTLGWGWVRKVTIYEVVPYSTLFSFNFSSPPQFFTYPSNASVWFDLNGATIGKVNYSVGFYLPIWPGINASRKNFLTVQIRLDVEDLELAIVFYFDRNRDGVFSDYVTDYAKTATFNQNEMGWVRGQWYTIYQTIPQGEADDPMVQIGFILIGDAVGTVTLKDLIVYTQTTS